MDTSYILPNLFSYFVIRSQEPMYPGSRLLQKLAGFKEIELAYVQSGLFTTASATCTGRAISRKGYMDPAPNGIDAGYAWTLKGGKGVPGVHFIDIEQGWLPNHEAIDIGILPLTGINDPASYDHGAAVLGVIMMNEKGIDGSGIAPLATGHVISQWRPDGSPNDADAILSAVTYLEPGDILLLETQSFYSPGNTRLWPAEIQDASFQAIRLATALGIIVIEAAGNGDLYNDAGNDLDLFTSAKKYRLHPYTRDFRDSGAIMVAAASSGMPHRKIRNSNFGKRINCYAWGDGVCTAGSYPASSVPFTNTYTQQFNGTSSASAIIAGAAISIQSMLEANHRPRLNPKQMRDVLSSQAYGTPSANGAAKDKIGVMPDLKKIIDLYLNL